MTDYSKLKVTELKELVKERGISSPNLKLKQHFVDALEAQDAEGGAPEGGVESADVSEKVEESAEAGDVTESQQQPAPDDEAAAVATLDGAGSDTEARKRKRRSPTPVPSEESVNKKLKAMAQANTTSQNGNVKATNGDEMDTSGGDDEGAQLTSPSRHVITRALYIRGLVRPLQPKALQAHLVEVATAPGDAITESILEQLHLDKLKTHAFVLFTSTSAAVRARNALHDQKYPDEPMRAPLWVDFIPNEKFHEWTNTESNQADMIRWEVLYSNDVPSTASLHEISNPEPSTQPASDPVQPPDTETMDDVPQEEPQFTSLDDRYLFTQAKPKLYYQPIPASRIAARLEHLAKMTSASWDEHDANPAAHPEGELRRYTFEDDRVVDSGADFGGFGRGGVSAPGGGGAGGGGFGGRRGGRGGGGGGGGQRRGGWR